MARKKKIVEQAGNLKVVAERQAGEVRGLAIRIRDEVKRQDSSGQERMFWWGIADALDASANALAEAAFRLNLHEVKRWRVVVVGLAAGVASEVAADAISEQVLPAAKAAIEILRVETETLPTERDPNHPTAVGEAHDAEINVVSRRAVSGKRSSSKQNLPSFRGPRSPDRKTYEGHIVLGNFRELGETKWRRLVDIDKEELAEGRERQGITAVVEGGGPYPAAAFGSELENSQVERRVSLEYLPRRTS